MSEPTPKTVADVRKMLRGEPLAPAAMPASTFPGHTLPEPSTVAARLETETGHEFVRTSDEPPTFVETDVPAKPHVPRRVTRS